MLTIADALQMPEFDGANVVAGRDGLHRSVSWVHVTGVPDAPYWLNGGELVLTTGFNLPKERDARCQYMQEMVEKNVAGLVLAVGRYIDHAPDYLRQIADTHNFPLIELPYESRFIDVAKATNQRIAHEHLAMVERAFKVHQVLTQVVLDEGDLQSLAVNLADLIGQSVSIEDEHFEALASVNIAEVDEARRFTVTEGRTDPRLVAALEERGILKEIRDTLRPVFIPQMPDVGLELERILAPIVVHGVIYGYVWIIADDRPLSDLDRMAIESGATIAALMMLHQEATQNAEASLKGSLMSQLIQMENGEREAILTDQALRYELDLNEPYVMLLVEGVDRGQAFLQFYRRINRLSSQEDRAVLVSQFAGQVVLLAQASEDIAGLAEMIHREIASVGTARVGISAQQVGARCVGVAHQQCGAVLHITRRLKNTAKTVYFEQLGYLHALYHAGPEALASNPLVPRLRRLLDEQQADLFNTLEAYLDEGGNGVQTAEMLHIHRSTLNYRLTRIVDICDIDLSDPTTRINLQVALKLMRLFEVD
ncbi:MAG: PucR family transcriptional regulator [Chloroflexi bacterium]|nr:MAG: PucR family transcriptional regulator [Chloroflexota bacterium]